MKKILMLVAVLTLVGAGCLNRPAYLGQTYANEQYGFAFDYPKEFEIHRPVEDHRTFDYLGLTVDYFGAVRDLSRSAKPDMILTMYASEPLKVEDFVKALEATSNQVSVTETKVDKIHKINVTMLTSTTESGTDKHHYLFDSNGKTIIFSEILYEQERAWPIVQTLRAVK